MIKKIWIPLIIILVIVGLFLIGRFWFKLGSKQYDSYEKFKKEAYLRLTVDIPTGASDQKFFTNNLGIVEYSLYAFTLDKEEYDKFKLKNFSELPTNITYGLDDGTIREDLVESLHLDKDSLPIFIIANANSEVVFVKQGYTIGLGEQMLKVIRR